ncbi:MAG TPA: glucose-6-phosphate dehydrogenase, partial [Roseiflexaceae bacterium]|nr:glucose-6-phosphate dehydrogenase [Roseiflexaceae bacterium]
TPEPCTVVIFGATGDLTHRKLVPALYNLQRERLLPPGFSVIGAARRDWSDDYFRQTLLNDAREHSRSPIQDDVWASFAEGISYVRVPFDDAEAYKTLAARLDEVDEQRGTSGNRLYYLATPPESYVTIIQQLGAAGLAHPKDGGWVRIIVEKPFGRDLDSARALDAEVHRVFDEAQVYRIDHYLGKETVQNILVFRFANGIFEPLWNRAYIDHVQITVAESVGVEGRGGYYEQAGALRDMVQNHLMQLLTLTAMEPPVSYQADAVRDEKVKVLRAIRPMTKDELNAGTVRGQYGPGTLAGTHVPGYREEEGVPPESQTATYAALRFYIENWRWAGVPFYLRTGKRLQERLSEIVITFEDVPHSIYERPDEAHALNRLVIQLQPDERITMTVLAKSPGEGMRLKPVNLSLDFSETFKTRSLDAYERLLTDVIKGNLTLFMRRDELDAAWQWVDPIREAWLQHDERPKSYTAGSWGPAAAS